MKHLRIFFESLRESLQKYSLGTPTIFRYFIRYIRYFSMDSGFYTPEINREHHKGYSFNPKYYIRGWNDQMKRIDIFLPSEPKRLSAMDFSQFTLHWVCGNRVDYVEALQSIFQTYSSSLSSRLNWPRDSVTLSFKVRTEIVWSQPVQRPVNHRSSLNLLLAG